MRTVTVRQYRFSELSKDAQAKAIDDNRYYHVEGIDWWDFPYNDALEVGLKIVEFDLGPPRKYIDGAFQESAIESVKRILTNHGKDCATYKTAKRFHPLLKASIARARLRGEDPDPRWLTEERFEHFDDFRKALLENYLDMLQEEYDYLTGDEAIAETLGDSWFDEDGNLVR